ISYGRPETESFFSNTGSIASQIDSSYENKISNAAGLHSDHQPFMLNGIPVLAFSGSLPPQALQCSHADCDHFDLVNKDEIEKTVRVASMYPYALPSRKLFRPKDYLPSKRVI